MTIKEILKKYPSIEIDLLLSHVLGKPKEFLYLHPEKQLTSFQAKKLSSFVRRRQKGEPIAYILGYKDFYGLKFKVNRNVLIPRPETEWLVDKIIEELKHLKIERLDKPVRILDIGTSRLRSKSPISILDVGTGSGCIAIALAKVLFATRGKEHLCHYQIVASDISKKALAVARQNANNILYHHTRLYDGKIKFIQSDLLDEIKINPDIIIANLPYVSGQDYEELKWNLKFEPKAAITDGTSKWILYEKFFEQVSDHINPGGTILFEIDPQAKPLLAEWVKKYLPKAKFKFYKDFHRLWRFMEIQV